METLTFKELGVAANILRCLDEMNFLKATPVQNETIKPLLEKRDLIAQAPTGTGKTFAFGIPVVQSIDLSERSVQSLILCPTRELAIQTTTALRKLTKFQPGIKVVAVYGGERIDRQIFALKTRPQIIVATPGRLMDHLDRRLINLDSLRNVILDEADRMLDMGFRDDLDIILSQIPQGTQTILFSATISPEITEIAKKYQKNAQHIQIAKQAVCPVEHFYTEFRDKTKTNALKKLLSDKAFNRTLVFVSTKLMADQLAEELSANSFTAEALHGGMQQRSRDKVMERYRSGQISILVATDVAARGIDVYDIDAVINYDIPQDNESYIHRIGRTGRAEKTGLAYTFIYPKERRRLNEIVHETKLGILPFPIDVKREPGDTLYAAKPSTFTAERAQPRRQSEPPKPAVRRDKAPDVTFMHITVGNRDGISPKKIISLLSDHTEVTEREVGDIKIFNNYTVFGIPSKHTQKVIEGFTDKLYGERDLEVKVSTEAVGMFQNMYSRRKSKSPQGFEPRRDNRFSKSKRMP